MPRIEGHWYSWHIDWKCIPWLIGALLGIYFSWWLIVNGLSVVGVLLFLFCSPFIYFSSRMLWEHRHPFVFTVRGKRKVRIRGAGPDGIVIQENGRKVYAEIGWSKTSHGKYEAWIYPKFLQKYEPPYDPEVLSTARRRDLLDLLCEHFEYQGTSYKIIMRSLLPLRMICPRCREEQDFEIELPFETIPEQRCRIGDKIKWEDDRPAEHGGRPLGGNVQADVGVTCPKCRRDFYMLATVKEDRLERVELNPLKSSFVPGDSTPIVENGKIIAHRWER